MIQVHRLTLLADYGQIHLYDPDRGSDEVPVWTAEDVETMLSTAPGFIAMGTARNMPVPVTLEIHGRPCPAEKDPWDRMAEIGIDCPSRRLVLMGCTDYEPDALTVPVPSDRMMVRVLWSGLNTVDDEGLGGEDRYVIRTWPDDADR